MRPDRLDRQDIGKFLKRNRNVMALMLAQAAYLACSMTVVTFGGLAGAVLAENKAWATLPMSLTIISTALSTGLMSLLMQRTSRRFGFCFGSVIGIGAALIAAYGLYSGSFVLLCVGTFCFGPFQASAQYYRFAAAESVPAADAPKAISMVLIGGLLGALVTPWLSGWFNDLFMPFDMLGVFIFVAVSSAFVLLPVAILRPLEKPVALEQAALDAAARPMSQIMRDPRFAVAVANGALGYAMMSFVMTATPLAMKFCGLGSASPLVIQGHVIAMFLPSLFTGVLVARLGIFAVLVMGHAAFAVAFLTALSGVAIGQFSIALIALGLGWNFCFVGATTLLTRVHSEAEKGRVQGINEFLVFGTTAAASLSAGFILSRFGWQIVNQSAFVMLAIVVAVTLFWRLMGGVRTAQAPRQV